MSLQCHITVFPTRQPPNSHPLLPPCQLLPVGLKPYLCGPCPGRGGCWVVQVRAIGSPQIDNPLLPGTSQETFPLRTARAPAPESSALDSTPFITAGPGHFPLNSAEVSQTKALRWTHTDPTWVSHPVAFLIGGPWPRLQLSASGSIPRTFTALWSGILSISIILRSQSCQQFGDRMTSFICAMFCAWRTSSTVWPITRKKLRFSSPKTSMVMWPAASPGRRQTVGLWKSGIFPSSTGSWENQNRGVTASFGPRHSKTHSLPKPESQLLDLIFLWQLSP